MWKRLTSCFTCGRRGSKRSGSPEKLTNISSSCESDSPESYAKQQEPGNKQTINSTVKPNSFGRKNEGAQGLQSDESDPNINESLRQRLSARKPQNGHDTSDKSKENSTQSSASNELPHNTLVPEKDLSNERANEKNLDDVLPVSKPKEVRKEGEFELKTNNVEISDQLSGRASFTITTLESSPGNRKRRNFVEQKIVQDVQADSLKATDKKQDQANINNANRLFKEPVTRESNTVQKDIKYSVMPEEEAKVTEVIFSETAFELKEESSFVEELEDSLTKKQPDIAANILNDNIPALNFDGIANDSIKPPGLENSEAKNGSLDQIDKFVADDVCDEEISGSVAANASIEQNKEFLVDNISCEEISGSVAANASIEKNEEFLADNISGEAISGSVSANAGVGQIDECVPNNVQEINDSVSAENAEFQDENQEASDDQILDLHANEVQPVIDNVIAKFSDRLSKHILDTVLQDTQLLYSQSEDEQDEIRYKESVLKFSDILAESIVRSVVDYSKVSQAHFSEHEEHETPMSPNVADACIKTNENTNQDVTYELSPPNEEDIFSADEANDESCCKNLHEYAKRLSLQILSDVLDLNKETTSSTNAYVSKLTETVLSNAIRGAKSQIGESQSLPDSDMGVESAIDLFITEIVGNAVESAYSKIAVETHRDLEEQNVNQRDIEGQHDMGDLDTDRDYEEQNVNQRNVEDPLDIGENLEGNVENLMDNEGHLEIYNGEIDSTNEDVDHTKHNGPCGSNSQSIQQNGKLQSKWLSEDDLDELYDDNDLSDEEDLITEESTKPDPNSIDDKETVISPNSLTVSNNEKQFWRKSLIEDLDDDFEDFDEIETPRSSMSTSPTKSGNFEDLMVDGSENSDDEVLETSFNCKVPVVMTTDPSRSRLRSVDTTPVLVLDNGSAFLKVGFSDQALPKEIVHSVSGTPLRYSQDISGMEYSAQPGRVYGANAMGKAAVLHIEYPLKSDLVEKWSDVEGLWNHALGSLMCIQDNPDFPVLISQPALNPKKNTEKIAEIMFEHFHMPSIFIADQLTLSLFSMGYTSGLSFCSGFKSTQAGVVYEGHVLPHTVKQLDIAGYQLTENLKKLLMSLQGFGFRSSSQWQIVDDIKKKLGYFSLDFAAESKRYKNQAELQTTYELPDGQVIEVGLERFGCAESLFRPMELGLTQSPAHMLIIEAINSCEEELQELCYKAMGVSGGTTQMNGFLARLEQELREHDRKFKNFTAPEHRDVSTWLGGSVVASLPTFREMVVTVDEYAESGARVVHSKCF